jgi:hypothetical protein
VALKAQTLQLARRSQLRWLAASVIVLCGAVMMPSCLVTSSPDFQDPKRTRPLFVPDLASPDPRKVIVVDSTTNLIELEGFIVGEDAGSPVQARVLRDYGSYQPDVGQPFQESSNGTTTAAGTSDSEPRRVSGRVRRESFGLTPGCHRLTLMVSHSFDEETGCPSDPEDYDELSWLVLVCDAPGVCPAIDLTKEKSATDDPSCPAVTVSCATPLPTTTSSSGGGGS